MKALISILCIWLTVYQGKSESESLDFCDIVKRVVSVENLEQVIQHESKVIGKCNAVVYETAWLKDKYKLNLREYKCEDNWRIAFFSYELMFSESVSKAIRFDKISMKKNKLYVTYSIVEFFHSGKKGFDMRTIATKKIKLTQPEEGNK